MTKKIKNQAASSKKLSFAERVVNWFSNGDSGTVSNNSLSVEIKGSSVTVDLSSVLGNRALAAQVANVKNENY